MSDVAVTELTDLDADKVAGVRTPANGTPFLLLKAQADKETCPTCDGSGKIRGGNVTCPDCKGTGEVAAKSDSEEADEQEDEMTGEAEKGKDDVGDAEESLEEEQAKAKIKAAKHQRKVKDAEDEMREAEQKAAEKADLSSAELNDLPDSAFAYIEPGGKKDKEGKTTPRSLRHYAVHDKTHADNAASRASAEEKEGDAKAKAIAKAAMPKIKSAQAKFGSKDAAKGDVQEALNGTATPEVGGHLDSGNSGVAGSVTGDLKAPPADASLTHGGESSYEIPVEARVRDGEIPATTDALGLVNPQAMRKASVIAAFAATLAEVEAQQAAAKDGSFLTATAAPAAEPGSMPWESYDSATLAQVSQCLAQCSKAVETIVKRELVEGDLDDAFDLECAASAIQEALGIAALLSFHEQAEGEAATKSAETFAAKVGRVLSGKNLGSVEAARDHLNAVIDGARSASAEDSSDEETDIMSTVTKEELSVIFAEESEKALNKAMKRAIKRLEKNANNGGDISAGDIKPTKTVDADDVNAVGGSVDSQYVNKGDSTDMTQGDGALEKELAEVRAQMESMQKSLEKIAKRPRAGGPLLTGQAAGLLAAAEGRMGEAAKGEADGEIERLQKSLEAATDPTEREQLGLELSHARLTELYGRRFPVS